MEKNNKDKFVKLHGKVAKFPKDTKAQKAYNFLENIKVSKKKLWYILIEKEDNTELQCIKYNNKMGVDLNQLVQQLKEYYSKDKAISEHISKLEIEGNDKFSIIRNIPPDAKIGDKKLITFLTEKLIQLLHK
jgi:protein associated with RNAse G/E